MKSAALLVASPRVFAPAVRAIFMGEFKFYLEMYTTEYVGRQSRDHRQL